MPKLYSSLMSVYHNPMAAVDLETTGDIPGYHEIVQIAIQPLNSEFEPLEGVRPFYWSMRPMHPERADQGAMRVHGLSLNELMDEPEPERVHDLLLEWWETLDLPLGKRITPLAHNWSFESSFLQAWLGCKLTHHLFYPYPRDAMLLALSLNDRAAMLCREMPFNRVGLSGLCRLLGIVNNRPHDALCDALAEAQVYKKMLLVDVF